MKSFVLSNVDSGALVSWRLVVCAAAMFATVSKTESKIFFIVGFFMLCFEFLHFHLHLIADITMNNATDKAGLGKILLAYNSKTLIGYGGNPLLQLASRSPPSIL
jgi:hypothetical protein